MELISDHPNRDVFAVSRFGANTPAKHKAYKSCPQCDKKGFSAHGSSIWKTESKADPMPCGKVVERIAQSYDSNNALFPTTTYLEIHRFEDCDSRISWVWVEGFSTRPARRPWTGSK